MRFGGGEFSTGTMGNFQPELTLSLFYEFRATSGNVFGRTRDRKAGSILSSSPRIVQLSA